MATVKNTRKFSGVERKVKVIQQ